MNLWRCVSFYFRYTNCVKIQRVRNYRNLIFNRCTMAGKILYILQKFRNPRSHIRQIILWRGKFSIYILYRGSEFPTIETETVALWRGHKVYTIAEQCTLRHCIFDGGQPTLEKMKCQLGLFTFIELCAMPRKFAAQSLLPLFNVYPEITSHWP